MSRTIQPINGACPCRRCQEGRFTRPRTKAEKAMDEVRNQARIIDFGIPLFKRGANVWFKRRQNRRNVNN